MKNEGREKTTMMVEAVAAGELWICAFHFSKYGILNDFNILDWFSIDRAVLQGKHWPELLQNIRGKLRKGPFC